MSAVQEPSALTASEVDLSTVRVVLVTNGLQVTSGIFKKTKPKNGSVNVEFGERSFTMTAEIRDKKGIPTNYVQKIKKLPGEIDKDACSCEYKKDQVIIILKKKEEISWAVQLSTSGLEQQEDE
ncbi:hypothetical protein SNE40_016976 [Patella caerulea]|uniref:CS domain-containing protein n=1 Tax=Patella caerulea TaxID=87958 RepID=A0AAN8JB09_PATCE